MAQRKSNSSRVYGGSDRLRRPTLGTPTDFVWRGGLPGGTSNPVVDRTLVAGNPGPLVPGQSASVMMNTSNPAASQQSNRIFDKSAHDGTDSANPATTYDSPSPVTNYPFSFKEV